MKILGVWYRMGVIHSWLDIVDCVYNLKYELGFNGLYQTNIAVIYSDDTINTDLIKVLMDIGYDFENIEFHYVNYVGTKSTKKGKTKEKGRSNRQQQKQNQISLSNYNIIPIKAVWKQH